MLFTNVIYPCLFQQRQSDDDDFKDDEFAESELGDGEKGQRKSGEVKIIKANDLLLFRKFGC